MRSTWVIKSPFGPIFRILIGAFIIITIILVSVTIWTNWALSAPSNIGQEKVFVIEKGESVESFTNRLEEENIIKNAIVFRIYLIFTGTDKKIQAGSFKLFTNLTAQEVSSILKKGRLDKRITIIEGLRKEEIEKELAEKFEINKGNFLKKAREGYLFPDTYLIPETADVDQILSIFDKNFNKRITSELLEGARKNKLTREQVIILASIVEREAREDSERPKVAGILIKRWSEGIPLAVDATIQYALGYSTEEKTWWRKNITIEDLEINSPFNTRKKPGLPPSPICNPGLSSIKAVVDPKDTPFYFYIHDKNGKIHYAKDFEEHQQNIQRYLK